MYASKTAIVATAATILSTSAVSAATLGTPSFTTAPARISIVNEFGPGGRVLDVAFAPFDSYSVSVSTTIASSFGVPSLVGATLEFSYGVQNGSPTSGIDSLVIDGSEVLSDPLSNSGSFLFFPPLAGDVPSATPGNSIFTYSGVFSDFGPRDAAFPEFEMAFQINQPLPTRMGFEQCNALNQCEFSSGSALSDVNGMPIVDSFSYSYIEGSIDAGTITFYTPGGPPPAAVPLPAGGVLLLTALGTAAFARRKTR